MKLDFFFLSLEHKKELLNIISGGDVEFLTINEFTFVKKCKTIYNSVEYIVYEYLNYVFLINSSSYFFLKRISTETKTLNYFERILQKLFNNTYDNTYNNTYEKTTLNDLKQDHPIFKNMIKNYSIGL